MGSLLAVRNFALANVVYNFPWINSLAKSFATATKAFAVPLENRLSSEMFSAKAIFPPFSSKDDVSKMGLLLGTSSGSAETELEVICGAKVIRISSL